MKNGFTLVELIVVISILAIIALISVPVVNNVITDSKEKAYMEQENSIVNAAKTYMTTHSSELPKDDEGMYIISVKKLKEEGLLKEGDIKNPVGANYVDSSGKKYTETDSVFDGCVEVTSNGNKYSYTYSDSYGGSSNDGSGGGSSGTGNGGGSSVKVEVRHPDGGDTNFGSMENCHYEADGAGVDPDECYYYCSFGTYGNDGYCYS